MFDDETFPQAVASFDPTSSAVLLWTRVLGAATEATAVVSRDPDGAEVVARCSAPVRADHDRTVVVEVRDLEPATTYWYRFEAHGARSPLGRTRTLPGEGATCARLGLVSCADYSTAPLTVYRALAETEVDLVVHLGDYLYESAGKGRRTHDPDRTAVSLDDYRRRLAQLRSDPDLVALHVRHPMVAIWDDHDLADNCWSTGAKAHDPSEHGDWDQRVDAAARARAEWLPFRGGDEDPRRTWRSVAVGDLAELLLLDTRIAGRDRHAGDDGTLELHDPRRSLLGDEQRRWLHGRLRDGEAPWALVASGVVVNQLNLPWPTAMTAVDQLLPNGYAVLKGDVVHDDQWDGFPMERDRLVEAIDDRASGPGGRRTVVLSGDVHSSWAFVGPCRPGDGTPVAVEVTIPAVSSKAMGRADYPGMSVVLNHATRAMDHVAWAEVVSRGFATVEVTRDAVDAHWSLVDPYADDATAGTDHGAGLTTRRADWPPAWVPAEAPTRQRPDGPPVPDRPEDLAALRRAHEARVWSKGLATGAAVVALVAAVAGRRRLAELRT